MASKDSSTPQRPRRRLSEAERRAQIIRGCVEVLARDGYRNASIARVADAAGVSKGLVSHYFGDRESLMEQTAIETVAHLRAEIATAIDLTREVPEILRAAILHASAVRSTHTVEMRALDQIGHNLLDADGAPRLDLNAYEDTYQAQERLLRRGQDEGTIRALDTRVAAVTYQAGVDAMIAYLDAHPETDRAQYADAFTDLIIGALKSRP